MAGMMDDLAIYDYGSQISTDGYQILSELLARMSNLNKP